MDSFKNAVGLGDDKRAEGTQQGQPTEQGEGSGGFLGGIGDKLNSAAGGGRESEKNEDYLDKSMSSPRQTVCLKSLCKNYY